MFIIWITTSFIGNTLAQEKVKHKLVKDQAISMDFRTLKITASLVFYETGITLNIIDRDSQESLLSYNKKEDFNLLYKSYFINFTNNDGDYYLEIGDAVPGKKFTLKHDTGTVQDLTITVLDAYHEVSTSGPAPDARQTNSIHQTLLLKVGDKEKKVSFYNDEIDETFFIEIDKYRIIPLNFFWQPYAIELMVYNTNSPDVEK